MELDELKYQLKNKLATDHAGRSDRDLLELLGKRTVSITDKLKKSLWIEIFFAILCTAGFAFVGFVSRYPSLRIYFSVFAIVGVGFLFILIYLLRRTSRLSAAILPVKSSLQSIVTVLEDFVKRYFQFTMALIPICFIFSFLLGYHEPKHIPAIDNFAKEYVSSSTRVIIFLILYMVLLGVGVYYFTRWYLKKLYGKYIVQLKECIEELKEE